MRHYILPMLLPLVSIGGCSCPKEATTPDPGTGGPKLKGPTQVDVTPDNIKEETKKQNQAVILGTKEGSTAIPLAGRERNVQVEAMWVRPPYGGQPATGGSSPAMLTTSPTSDNKVRVGTFEEFAGGAGDMMRASVWMSSFVSTQVLGKDLTDFRFSAEYEGFIDGPSAGGLMTAGFLAAMTGDELLPEVTMTGTINPDGTIGPVGGIAHKVKGSAEKGKKRMGYPIGQRYDFDMNKNAKVDLQEVAKENNVTVHEIGDIYQAYEFMTGKKLPRPEPVDVKDMALGDETEKQLAEKFASWLELYQRHLGKLAQIDKAADSGRGLPTDLVRYATRASTEGDLAIKLKEQGLTAAAYYHIVRATVAAATATSTWDVWQEVFKGDVKKAKGLLAYEMKTTEETLEALTAIGKMTPDTITDHLLQISAFQPAIAAWGHEGSGAMWMADAMAYVETLEGKSGRDLAAVEVQVELVAKVAPAIEALTRGEALARVAMEALEIESTEGLAYRCSLPNAAKLASSFGSAAVANLAYFDSLLVEPFANAKHLSMEKAQAEIMKREPRYLVATMAFRLPMMMKLAFEWEDGSLPAVLATLSGSILSYFNSAVLVSQYYSLQISRKADGEIGVENEKAMAHMLEQAELKAREYSKQAKVAIGQIPLQARLHYQIAIQLREGKIEERLRALEEFWQASAYAQVALMLARN